MQRNKLFGILGGFILPLPVMIVGLYFFSSFMNSAMAPKPEDAKLKTSLLFISRKSTKVTYDSDGDPTTQYYVYYTPSAGSTTKEESLKVTSSMYDSVQESGEYYYVVADDGSKSQGFAFYPAKKYQIEVSN